MGKVKDITGMRFSRLTIIKFKGVECNHAVWFCRCDCGNEVIARGGDIRQGKTKSCGCLSRDNTISRSTKHGCGSRSNKSGAYIAWKNMIRRCGPNAKEKHRYYEKGITVCQEWRQSFEQFLLDMGEPKEGFTLERINNNDGYKPDNCMWASRKQQTRNRDITLKANLFGVTKPVAEWAERLNIEYNRIYYFISRGNTPEKAINLALERQS